MAFPNWNRLSDSIHASRIGARGTAGMPILKRRVHRADSRLAGKQALGIFDIRRTIGDGRIVALRPHSYATRRWRIFSGARRRVCVNATASWPHPAHRHFTLQKSNVARGLLAAVVGCDRSPNPRAGLSTYQALGRGGSVAGSGAAFVQAITSRNLVSGQEDCPQARLLPKLGA